MSHHLVDLDDSIDERQITKLISQTAFKPFDGKQIRVGDKRFRPWQFVKNKYFTHERIKEMLIAQET